jgi:hypothetical protein
LYFEKKPDYSVLLWEKHRMKAARDWWKAKGRCELAEYTETRLSTWQNRLVYFVY